MTRIVSLSIGRRALLALFGVLAVVVVLAPPAIADSPRLGRVHFVPLEEPVSLDLVALASHYQERFGIAIGIQAPVKLTIAQVNTQRQQLIAEELIALMRRSYPALNADPQALLIGLTEYDMYIRNTPQWRFAFAMRTEGRFAVISAARMDPASYGEPTNPDLLHTRVRKMITKTIGLLYFGLPLSSDPNSVLYENVLGLDDLDAVGEDF